MASCPCKKLRYYHFLCCVWHPRLPSHNWSRSLSIPFHLPLRPHPPLGQPSAASLCLSLSCWLFFQFEINCGSLSSMPNVVFQINGKKYPLPPSAYISQVCASGWGGGAPGSQALRPPGSQQGLWGECRACGRPAGPAEGALWSPGRVCDCCTSSREKLGRTEAWVWGRGEAGPLWGPLSTAQGPGLSGVFLGCLGLWRPRFPAIGFDLILSAPNQQGLGSPRCSGRRS